MHAVPETTGPLYRVIGLLGPSVRKQGTGYVASCPGPAHAKGDRHPSLSLALGYDGRAVLHCHAGCTTETVLAALGLTYADLFDKDSSGTPLRRYRVIDRSGRVLAEHVRRDSPEGKDVWWESAGKRGLNGTKLESLPLYRAPELEQAPSNVPAIITEGEKSADALADLGLLAVGTVTGAAGTPSEDVLAVLRGREVWLWPDNDADGRSHMARIAVALKKMGISARWIIWGDAPQKGDAADYVGSGGSAEGVRAMLRDTPPEEAGPERVVRIWNAAELMGTTFKPPKWAVPDLLPEGLTILAGRPKLGKSWLGLGLAIDISAGGKALHTFPVTSGEVLYMALEDGPRRMQERLAAVLGDQPVSPRLHLATEWARMNEGGLEDLDAWLRDHPQTRLVVIDTFKRVRPVEKGNKRLYDNDYDAIQPVAELAREHGVAIVVVFHTRKGESEDPLESVSGTLGLSGAADAVMVLRRERGQADASLFVTGRDIEEQDLALRWEKDDMTWRLLGDADVFRRSLERQQIIDALVSVPGLRPNEIADATGRPAGPTRRLLFSMVRDGEVRVREGKYFPGVFKPEAPTPIGNTGNVGNVGHARNAPAPLSTIGNSGNAGNTDHTRNGHAPSPARVTDIPTVTAITDVTAVTAHGEDELPWR